MNFENSKKCDPHRLLLNLSDKINLKRSDKYVTLSNFCCFIKFLLLYQILAYSIYRKKYVMSYKKSEFKILAPTWNDKFELPE